MAIQVCRGKRRHHFVRLAEASNSELRLAHVGIKKEPLADDFCFHCRRPRRELEA